MRVRSFDMSIPGSKVFALLGEEGFQRLVAAFYARVRTDDLLRPMYPQEDLDGAQERLTLFLIQRFGGPMTYSEQRGHPRLRMRHAPFVVDQAARDRWVKLMDEALVESQTPPEAAQVLRRFFADTATFMINQGGENSEVVRAVHLFRLR